MTVALAAGCAAGALPLSVLFWWCRWCVPAVPRRSRRGHGLRAKVQSQALDTHTHLYTHTCVYPAAYSAVIPNSLYPAPLLSLPISRLPPPSPGPVMVATGVAIGRYSAVCILAFGAVLQFVTLPRLAFSRRKAHSVRFCEDVRSREVP